MAGNSSKELIHTNSCRVCGSINGLRRCSSCKIAYYCSQTHQKLDWRNHKTECKMINNNSKMVNNNQTSECNPPQQQISASKWPVTEGITSNSSVAKEVTSECELINAGATCSQSSKSYTQQKPSQQPLSSPKHKDNKKERENNHQRDFKHLSENTMQINDVNLINSNLLTRLLLLTSIKPSKFQLIFMSFFFFSNELGNDGLCKHIINDMNKYGLSVIDDFLGRPKGLEILNEVHHMYAAGLFQVLLNILQL